jgi:outer membrane protein
MGEIGDRGCRVLRVRQPKGRATIYAPRLSVWSTIAAASVAGWACTSSAETMQSALVKAYQNNPQLNAQRANARSIDENVPQALSGYRPKLAITGSIGEQYTSLTSKAPSPQGPVYINSATFLSPWTVGVTGTQTLFNGFQTANRTRAAESQVSGAREALRVIEQTILLNAATAYMDVLRDTANLEVQQSNVRVLQETLKQTRDRFDVGEVTRTDVAQAEAQLAAGQSAELAAESTLTTSKANYRQLILVEPVNLAPGSPVDRFFPKSLAASIDLGLTENPNVTSAMYGVDVSFLQVKINQGALLPVVSAQISAQQQSEPFPGLTTEFLATATANVTIPIYQGGSEYSLIRQSKESLAQQRLTLDLTRNQVRQAVVQAWGQLEAAKAQVVAAQSQVTSSEVALNGVREEARVGQRTTLDVLNAQQALVNARVALVTAQHDRVVASYNVLSAVGRLSPQVLGLSTPVYDPMIHYQQVRDAWVGLRNPDGR